MAPKVSYGASHGLFTLTAPPTSSNLTHLHCEHFQDIHIIFPLIRNNCKTLEELEIELEDSDQFENIVCDENGHHLQYPRLKVLKSSAIENATIVSRVELTAPPFPSLEHLSLAHVYPFEDDAPFQ
ncbi:hypothetical protein GGH94_004329, partial [Coemansia aciculifera]